MADGGGSVGARLNLLKLCVGAETISDLEVWQTSRAAERRSRGELACPVHTTRMWPRRQDELLAGGSLYWVIKGVIRVRQRIVALEEVFSGEGVRHCSIVLDPDLVRVEGRACRPFQGWRYLTVGDAPIDIPQGPTGADALPDDLEAALSALGVRPAGVVSRAAQP
ncbi:MAG: DUF1489 domain-containing protein [Pseudomonadota bacterium]